MESTLPPSLSIQTTEDAEMVIVDEPDEIESDDSPMNDAASMISENDSPEMLYVKEQESLIRASEGLSTSQGQSLQPPPSSGLRRLKPGMDLIDKNYTVIVLSTTRENYFTNRSRSWCVNQTCCFITRISSNC